MNRFRSLFSYLDLEALWPC